MRGTTPAITAAVSAFSTSRRRIASVSFSRTGSADDGLGPGGLLLLGLRDRGIGEGLGVFSLLDRVVELAGLGRRFRRLERAFRDAPLVLERLGLLLGGFRLVVGRLEILGRGGERGAGKTGEQQNYRESDQLAHFHFPLRTRARPRDRQAVRHI